jgi:hypothetical protein
MIKIGGKSNPIPHINHTNYNTKVHFGNQHMRDGFTCRLKPIIM